MLATIDPGLRSESAQIGTVSRTPPPHPQATIRRVTGEGGEDRREDADAERHGEAAHRAGADIEQHRGRDERGDVGVENGRERAGEAGIDAR